MFGEQEAKAICEQLLVRAGGDALEVILAAQDQSLTRFANNEIHQNVYERNLTLTVRLAHGKRLGLASTNRSDPAGLAEAVEYARLNAEASPEDINFPGFSEPVYSMRSPSYDRDTAEYPPHQRASAVQAICRLAAESHLNAYGAFSTGSEALAVANTNGLYAYHLGSQASFLTRVMSEDSSGHAEASAWKVDSLPVEDLGRHAIEKARRGRSPRPVEAGEYTVVIDPYVTQDLLENLNFHGMSAQAVLEGRSWMNDRLGQQAMSPRVSIWDDGLDPAGLPRPFDFEGTPCQRVSIVDKGVIGNPVHDRTTAQQTGVSSTGHALPPAMRAYGPLALNLFIAPGEQTIDDMIRGTSRGLYITRLWYTRLVHPRDCVVTGMTRDGVFLIEDGELAYPVKNLRFTQSYVGALANVEAVGRERRLLVSDWGSFAVHVPAMKISAFNFTGSTV
jgi:predicted Zn-dependent protease